MFAHQKRQEGWTLQEIADALGFQSKGTISKMLSGFTDTTVAKMDKDVPPPLRYEGLSKEAKDRLADFRKFRLHYFERETPPFQLEIANNITKALEGDTSLKGRRLLFLEPPGHGKSTMVSLDFCIWQMIRARAHGRRFACLNLSQSKGMAADFIRDIKQHLEQNENLQRDYGWFKPEHPDVWEKSRIMVDGFDYQKQGKEATFISGSPDSHIYGYRVNLIVGDDLIDDQFAKSPEKNEDRLNWFTSTVRSRLNKGGVLVVVGTRWSNHDFHGLVTRMQRNNGEPMFTQFIYPAHDDSKCPGHCECSDECDHHPAYPEGCLLWPEWVSYAELQEIKEGSPSKSRFEFVYNQVDVGDEESLFRKEWVDACKDDDRMLWQPGLNRPDVPSGCQYMATLDPSPTKWACAQVWAYDPGTQMRYLVAIHRDQMSSPDYLRLMRTWTTAANDLGIFLPWVFEINAAQRWLLESQDYKNLRLETGLKVYEHTTSRNKLDPEYGVQAMQPLFEYQKVSIPWKTPDDRKTLAFFINELITYPEGTTDDGVMSMWFHFANSRLFDRKRRAQAVGEPMAVGPYFQKKSGLRRVK